MLRQGDRCVPVVPFDGEQPVEEFYDYRLPKRLASETAGSSDPGSGPYYSSAGTEHLQRDGSSLLLLYDGPNGLSLVVIHGSLDPGQSGGGAATFEFADLPDDGAWVVRDDYYLDPDTGAPAGSNYDRWRLDDQPQVVDWTWKDSGTDGGAFRGLDGEFPLTVDPAFNDQAALFETHYQGTVESWELLVPDGDGVRRTSLDMTAPVTIETGACGGGTPEPEPAPRVRTVEFKGCGEAWIVFADPFDGTVEATVETSVDEYWVEITGDDLVRVPGQFGTHPLFKWRSGGNEKVFAVKTSAGRVENDHQCTRAGDGEDGSAWNDGDGGDGGTEAEAEEGGAGERDDAESGENSENGRGNGGGEGDGRGDDADDEEDDDTRGPPDEAGPPDKAGPPDEGGPRDHAGPPDDRA